ncbi:hypothetical protein DXG01_006544 [Tephrocybe rancida]|nr:hypothetical protein DXG01_006544 [Tephrocybe rancida]
MRFSTVAVLSTITLAGFSAACTKNDDCPRGQTCQFLSTKDSQGRCYKRGEGPAAAGVGPSASKKVGRKRSIPRRNIAVRSLADHNEALELAARGVVDAAMEAIVARSFEDFEDLD